MRHRKIIFVLTVLLAMIVSAGTVWAQGTFSRLTGTVLDANGAAVAGATVTLTNEGTNIAQTAETSESGVFTFDSILVGNYRVEVEKQGFKKFLSNNNVVNVGSTTTVNAALETGAVTETVIIEAVAENVQTGSSGNIGNVVEQRTLEALPLAGLRGRNPLEFINFQPGVAAGANTGGGVHVNGARDRAFNFTLDGIDINETSAGGSNFTPLRPNPDSIAEFQIITSNFTADQGRSSGAQVGLVTRAGTNRFTGTAFEFYQTPDFNANEFENNINNIAKRQFVQHIFGGSLGGPIIKDRAFFFTNVQLLRAYETRLVSRTVYTSQARQGIFRYVVGGQNRPAQQTGASVDTQGNPLFPVCSATVTTGCIATYDVAANNPGMLALDPSVLAVLRLTPTPNNFIGATGCTPDGLNTGCFNFAAPQREKQYDFVVRGDYNFNSKNSIYIRYAQGEQNTVGDSANGGLAAFPDTPNLVDTFRNPKNLAANYRITPTSNTVNEFIYGFNRFGFSFNNPDENFASNPPFAFNNGLTLPLNNTPTVNNARFLMTHQFVDNLTYIRGSHTFKGGINFRFQRHLDNRNALTTLTAGLGLTTNNTPDLTAFRINTLTGLATTDRSFLQGMINNLLGRVSTVSRSFVAQDDAAYLPAGEGLVYDSRYKEYDFYFQDTWKFRPNVTFDLGLRWELRPAVSSEGNPILRPNQLVTLGATPSNTLRFEEGDLYDDDFNNLSPSLGVAWDPFSDGKTSIRANYRLAYDRMNTFVLSSAVFQTLPGLINQSIASAPSANTTTNAFLLRNLPTLAPNGTPQAFRQPPAFGSAAGITVVDPDLQYPETNQWAISFQRDIGFNLVAEASYIGRRGTHLFGAYDVNQANIYATDSRCGSQTFLDAFNAVRGGATDVCLTNLLFTGSPTNAAGTASFRTAFATALTPPNSNPTLNVGGGVGLVAAQLSQRTGANQGQFIAQNGVSPFFFQPFPQFAGFLNVLDSNDYSRYNALEVLLKRRITDGLGFQLAYTLARSKDTRSFDPAFTTAGRGNGQSASSTPLDLRDRSLNYTLSDFDRKHSFQATYVYELPFGKGKRFFGDSNGIVNQIVGGFQLSGLVIWASGRPFTVFSGVNTASNVVQSTANCDGCPRSLGGLIQESGTTFYFNQSERPLFSAPAPGEIGNTGRNYFVGPGTFQTNMALAKLFRIDERRNIELRVDAQNLTNTPTFGFPTTTLTSTTFGRIRDTVLSFSRRVQVGVKVNF